MATPQGNPTQRSVRVPSCAWTWLQRSRPVLSEVALRLYGREFGSSDGFDTASLLDQVQEDFLADPFARDVVDSVVCDVAFGSRVPTHRPADATWDRGLVWWAAWLAGVSVGDFEARSATTKGTQAALFPASPARRPARKLSQPRHDELDDSQSAPLPRRASSLERAALARALRELLDTGDGHQIPATAVRQLLTSLEE